MYHDFSLSKLEMTMRKTKNIALVLFSVVTLTSAMLHTPTAPASMSQSGNQCVAANLNQALLGLSWGRFGIRNDSTFSLFVVCPILRETSAPAVSNLLVTATFPSTGGSVGCVYRAENAFSGIFLNASLTISAGQASEIPTRGSSSLASNGDLFPGTSHNMNLICLLDPNEGISRYLLLPS